MPNRSPHVRFLAISILLWMALFVRLSAQSVELNGHVRDQRGETLVANVLLLSPDSLLVAGALSGEDGFRLTAPAHGDYLLQISCLGQKTLTRPLHLQADAPPGLDSLILADDTEMEAVEITGKVTPFEQTSEGLRLNVANTLLGKSANAQEMLTRAPGVSISGRQVLLLGRGEAVIYLDGKEIPLETFRSLPVSEISHVEVISNPSAKYDAKGKAVILVTMRKSYRQGLLATVTDNATLALVPARPGGVSATHNAGLNLDLRRGKLNMNAYYANDLGNTWMENHYTNSVNSSAGSYLATSHYEENSHAQGNHTYRLGAGTQVGRRGNLSAQYDGLTHDFALEVAQDADYASPAGAHTLIAMRNAATTRLQNHSLNLNYTQGLDSLGSELFVGVQGNRFSNALLDHITETITRLPGEPVTSAKINDSDNLIHLWTAQADLTQMLKKAWKLETGIKFSHITNEGSIRFLRRAEGEGQFTEDPLLANGNRYREDVPAAYAMLSGSLLHWNCRLGLRAEYSDVEGYSQRLGRNIVDSTYANLFPSLHINRALGKHASAKLSLSRRISRPLYQDMDPFLWYLDSLTSIQGNPRLTPELLHQAEAGFTWRSVTLRAGYTRSTSTLWLVGVQGSTGPNSVIYTKDNLRRRDILTAGIDLSTEAKWHTSWTSLTLNYWRFVDGRYLTSSLKPFPQLHLYTYHQFSLPKDFKLDLTAEYYSTASDGMTRRKPYYYATAGLSRSFLKGQLDAGLMFNDFLRTAVWGGTRHQGEYVNDYSQRYMLHYLRLSLTLRLGSVTRFDYRNRAVNEKEYARIKQ